MSIWWVDITVWWPCQPRFQYISCQTIYLWSCIFSTKLSSSISTKCICTWCIQQKIPTSARSWRYCLHLSLSHLPCKQYCRSHACFWQGSPFGITSLSWRYKFDKKKGLTPRQGRASPNSNYSGVWDSFCFEYERTIRQTLGELRDSRGSHSVYGAPSGNSVRCRYNTLNFIENPHNRHSSPARVSAVLNISCYTGPNYIGTRLYSFWD